MRRKQFVAFLLSIPLFFSAPILALKATPVAVGPLKKERLLGAAAEKLLNERLASNPKRYAAYQAQIKKLQAKGLKRSAVVALRAYHECAQQSAFRRFVDWVVPALQAQEIQTDSADEIWDDWSGYNPHFDGVVFVGSWDYGYRDATLGVGFNKDPETTFATDYIDVLDYNGWDPDSSPDNPHEGAITKIGRRIVDAIYPTAHAKTKSKSWWSRLQDWATCTVGGCTTAAGACFIANVYDAEALWAPCWVAWCGGSEIGCGVYALIS